MKTTKLHVFLKFSKTNSVCLIFLVVVNSLISCSSSKPAFPKEWTPIEEDLPLESYSGQYNFLLLTILGSDFYKQDNVNNCLVDFWINDNLEFKFRLKCKDDIDSKNNTIFPLVNPNKKVEIKKEKTEF